MRERHVPRFATFVLLALLFALAGGVGRSGAGAGELCTTSGPLVCVSVSGTPSTVPPSDSSSSRYISYLAQVTNRSRSTVTHVTARASLSAGMTLVSVTPSGSCTSTGSASTCALGNLASGASMAVALVAKSPQSEGTAAASFTVSFDEGFNDGPTPDPKQDTVSAGEQTTIAAVAGSASSFVPQGTTVELSTDPTESGVASPSDPLIADAGITSSPVSLIAMIEEVSAPLVCPKRLICRGGDWVHASIPGAFDPPLAFDLRWDDSLIPSNLNAKKFAVLYTECLDGCPLEVVSARCSSATPGPSQLPCLWNVARQPDGDWIATLFNSHNGYMH